MASRKGLESNRGSRLLQDHENNDVFASIGRRCVSLSTSVVQVFHCGPNERQWQKKHEGVACLVKDNTMKSYFIRVVDVNKRLMVWEQELHNQFNYNPITQQFHSFEGDHCVVGLSFADYSEAHHFQQKIEEKLASRQRRKIAPPLPPPPQMSAHSSSPTSSLLSDIRAGGTELKTVNNIHPRWKKLFDTIGVTQTQLEDEETCKFIWEFVKSHGGIEWATKDLEKERDASAPPSPPPKMSVHSSSPTSTLLKTNMKTEIAARSNSIDQTIHKELECTVCLEMFIKPKLLGCMHTFCEDCLLPLVQNINAQKQIKCPSCREITKVDKNGASSLPTNYIADNVIEKLNNANKIPLCHDCVENTRAIQHCKNCKLNLCEQCIRYHQKSVKFSGHVLILISQAADATTLDSTPRYCKIHNELLKYFCENCKILVCNDCMISDAHRRHAFGLIDEVKTKMKKDIHKMVDQGEEVIKVLDSAISKASKFEEEAKTAKQQAIATVNEVFTDLQEQLLKKKEQILKEVSAKFDQNKSLVEAQKEMDSLAAMVSYSLSVSNAKTGFQEVEVLHDIQKQLQASYDKININQILSESRIPSPPQQNAAFLQPNAALLCPNMSYAYYMQYVNAAASNQRNGNNFRHGGWNSMNQYDQYIQHYSNQQRGFGKGKMNGNGLFYWSEKQFQREVGNIKITLCSSDININENIRNALENNIEDFVKFE